MARPMSCVEAVLFQLINPKAWMMAITVARPSTASKCRMRWTSRLPLPCACRSARSCMLIWTLWGASIDQVLKRPRARQLYRYGMAAAVALTAVWMLR